MERPCSLPPRRFRLFTLPTQAPAAGSAAGFTGMYTLVVQAEGEDDDEQAKALKFDN